MTTPIALEKITSMTLMPAQAIDFQSFFSVGVEDLASYGQTRYAGIYCAAGAFGAEKSGLTEQFTDKAADYHRKYSGVPYFKELLTCATNGLLIPEKPVILDLGSGSGNTVIAALDLFPSCSVVAIDLSEELLAILRDYTRSKAEYDNRLFLMCQDACTDTFRHGSIDLVLGGAILHHLIDPSQAIIAALRALKPRGYAIFFEPFENGASILRLAIQEILKVNDGHTQELEPAVKQFLKAIDYDYEVRTGTDKSAPIYRKIDDKWLFTRSYFERCAAVAGATDMKIHSIDEPENQYSVHIKMLLKVGIERDTDALPEWAWNIVARYDSAFSGDLRKDLFLQACVLIRK
jgi:SAM-dependent methyltransferase